jgi:glycerophosphoryl diester phosphodiesterase
MLAALVYADEELRLRVSIPTIDEATMHERAFADVDAHGDVRELDLIVPKGAEPEGAALKLCLKEVGPGAGLVDCVVQLASHATVERILRRTPDDEPLPSLSLKVSDETMGTFEHAEGADFAEEALAFCSRVVREEKSKSIVKNCAKNLKAQARRKVTQLLVDEQTPERRKAIEEAVDASLSSNPDKWKKARRRRKDR